MFLTFDDGPFPETTEDLLLKLKELNIKATFFCSGKQISNHPYLVKLITKHGHLIGHHGYEHMNGWVTKNNTYIDDVKKSKQISKSILFRPPFGKMKWGQYSKLKTENKIVLWDNMPGDFETSLSEDIVVTNFKKNIRDGSIIVLHDNPKSKVNCLAVLDSIKHDDKLLSRFKTLDCLLEDL